jgi:3D (Asp-Asp-Asp) domain-containing protein
MKHLNNIGMVIVIASFICTSLVLLPREGRGVVAKYALELKPLSKVSLTTYTTDTAETDSFPLITASGLRLDSANPKKGRVIAISRDLQKLFSFGDKVKLSNAGKFNGIWFIHDLMNKKWKNKIDILINPDETQMSLEGVVISKI